MQAPVTRLVSEFVRSVKLPHAVEEEEVYLRTRVAEFASNAAMLKRDMRRLLEKDPRSFLRAACRVLRECDHGPGAIYLADLLWSSARLFDALADPQWMPLTPAITLAKLWIPWEPLLDIKLLQIGFSSDPSAANELDMARAHRVLAILRELPTEKAPPAAFVESAAQPACMRASDCRDLIRTRRQQSRMGLQAPRGR